MSNAVFPNLPGQNWPIIRSPWNSTTVVTTVSGREYRAANWAFPKYVYQLTFDVLRQGTISQTAYAEFNTLMGFFASRLGSFDSFLYNDQDDNTVSLQTFGIGDGATRAFQLIRTIGGSAEPVFELQGAPTIFVNGAPKTLNVDYTITLGVVSFFVAPPATQLITWTGQYYWRCRFQADNADFYKNMGSLWELIQNPLIFTTTQD